MYEEVLNNHITNESDVIKVAIEQYQEKQMKTRAIDAKQMCIRDRNDIVLKFRVYKRLYILLCSKTGGAVLCIPPEFFRLPDL